MPKEHSQAPSRTFPRSRFATCQVQVSWCRTAGLEASGPRSYRVTRRCSHCRKRDPSVRRGLQRRSYSASGPGAVVRGRPLVGLPDTPLFFWNRRMNPRGEWDHRSGRAIACSHQHKPSRADGSWNQAAGPRVPSTPAPPVRTGGNAPDVEDRAARPEGRRGSCRVVESLQASIAMRSKTAVARRQHAAPTSSLSR